MVLNKYFFKFSNIQSKDPKQRNHIKTATYCLYTVNTPSARHQFPLQPSWLTCGDFLAAWPIVSSFLLQSFCAQLAQHSLYSAVGTSVHADSN